MKLSSLQEMIKNYERITGESISFEGFFFDDDLHDKQGTHFKFFPNAGFLFWQLIKHERIVYFQILETYGRFHKMTDYIREVMMLNDVKDIVTMTTRNPKGHIRRWKMVHHPEQDYDYEGRHYYVLTGTIENLH